MKGVRVWVWVGGFHNHFNGAFGSGTGAIQSSVDSLNVDTSSANGDQWVAESGALMGLNINAGTGTVNLEAGGTVTDGDAAMDVVAATLNASIAGDFGAAGGSDRAQSYDARIGGSPFNVALGLARLDRPGCVE